MIAEFAPYLHLFEHSPWVVTRGFLKAPFADKSSLHNALLQAVNSASIEEQDALICAHPELATSSVPLTEASDAEQTGAGLKSLTLEEINRFSSLNKAYREKFMFPFIICVSLHTKKTILEAFETRLENDKQTERQTALNEIAKITRLRLERMT